MALQRFRRALGEVRQAPGLLVLCGLIGAGEVAAWLLVAPFLAPSLAGPSPVGLVGWVLGQRLLLLLVLAALLPGCYAAARERLRPRAALRATADRIDTAGPRVLVSMVVSRALALGPTVVAIVVALTGLGVLDTASVWTDAFVGVGVDRDLLALLGVPAAVVGATALARGAVGLHDLRAIDGGDAPATAAVWSLLAWRGRRRGLVGYAIVRGVLLGLPVGVGLFALAVGSPAAGSFPVVQSSGWPALPAVAFVAATALARATLVTYQVAIYDRVATERRGAVQREPTPVVRRRGVLLAAVVVLAAMVGLAAIRTADVQPPLAEEVDVDPADASATIETAIERTESRDLLTEQRTDARSEATGEWVPTTHYQALLQRSDRSVRFYAGDGNGPFGGDRAIYATDGRFAMLHDPTPPATPGPLHVTIERGPWTVLVGPPYGWGIEEYFAFPPADAGWRLAEATDDELVYRLESTATVAGRDLGPLPDVPASGVALGNETGATIVIDRQLVTLRRATMTVDYVEDRGGESRRVAKRWERHVTKIGDVEAHRPGSVGSPSLPARLWDVVYY